MDPVSIGFLFCVVLAAALAYDNRHHAHIWRDEDDGGPD